MARQFTTPIVLPADPVAPLQASTKQYVDNNYVPNSELAVNSGVATLDSSGDLVLTQVPPSLLTTAQRGPIGGVNTITYASTITPNAATASEQRVVATGALAVNVPTGGTDGQYLLLWVNASSADRVVTFNASYENSQTVPGSVFTVPSGTWGSFLARLRGSTWVLMAASPQPGIAPVTLTYASTISVDASLGNEFRITATGNPTISAPTNTFDGQKLLFEITASGAARSPVFASGYELGGVVTSRTVAIASGLVGYVGVHIRGTTPRLLAVDDGS